MKFFVSLLGCALAVTGICAQDVKKADLVASTHVGNGDPTSPNERIVKLVIEITGNVDVTVQESKSSPDQILEWCGGAGRVLQREFDAAKRLIMYGKLEEASQVMVDALSAVNNSFSMEQTYGGPVLKTLAYRGLQIIRVLEDNLPTDDANKRLTVVTKAYFLERYVAFAIEMERYLDRPYWVDYNYRYTRDCDRKDRHDHRHCVPEKFDIKSMMQRYLEMSAKQLRFTNDFVDKKGNSVVPLGSPKAHLKIAELEASFIAQDLRGNLYAVRNACEIRDLESLSEQLRDFNDNDRSRWFGSTREAIQFAYTEINRTATSIEGVCKECEREAKCR